MVNKTEMIPELQKLQAIREEKKGKIKLFSITAKNYLRARRKYIRKRLNYFSVMDKLGTYFSYGTNDVFECEIADSSTTEFKTIVRGLKSMTYEDAGFAVLHLFMKDRLTYEYGFILADMERVGVIDDMLKADKKMLDELEKKQDEEDGEDDV